MDYDDVIERAKAALCAKAIEVANEDKSEDWFADQYIRAAAPILMEYGARLMRAKASKVPELSLAGSEHAVDISDAIRTLDPATIVREAVK